MRPSSETRDLAAPAGLFGERAERSPDGLASPHDSGRLARDTAATTITRLVAVVLGVVATVVVTRALGPDGRGAVAVAGALATTLVQVGLLGLHSANAYRISRDARELPALLGNSLAASGVVGGGIALATYAVAWWRPDLVVVQGVMLGLVLAWVPFGVLALLLSSLLQGLGDVRGYNLSDLVTRLASVGLALAVVAVGAAIPSVVFASAFSALVIGVGYSAHRLRAHLRDAVVVSMPLLTDAMRYGARAWIACLCGYLTMRLDLIIVWHRLGTHDAGVYSIAASLGDHMLILPTSLAAMLLPRLSAEPDAGLRLRVALRSAGVMGLLLGTALAASVAAGPWLFGGLFGAPFLEAASIWRWLAPGVLFYGVEVVIAQYLSGSGFPRSVVAVWVFVTGVNLGATVWAVDAYGMAGAAAVSTATWLLLLVLIVAVAFRHARATNDG